MIPELRWRLLSARCVALSKVGVDFHYRTSPRQRERQLIGLEAQLRARPMDITGASEPTSTMHLIDSIYKGNSQNTPVVLQAVAHHNKIDFGSSYNASSKHMFY